MPHWHKRRQQLHHQGNSVVRLWLRKYNQIRPHHALSIRSPIPETLLAKAIISGTEKWARHLTATLLSLHILCNQKTKSNIRTNSNGYSLWFL